MKTKTWLPVIATILGTLLVLVASISPVQALIPNDAHYVKYIRPDWTVEYWGVLTDEFVQNTLPNEWIMSWSADALRAGTVIIRSGVYWRTNRSVLGSTYPNANCWQVFEGGTLYYSVEPFGRGGREMFIPGTETQASRDRTWETTKYHAERTFLPSGRPDRLVPLMYGNGIQTRTNDGTGTWLQRIRYAYTGPGHPGSPVNPNQDCNQSDSQTSTDPVYPNY